MESRLQARGLCFVSFIKSPIGIASCVLGVPTSQIWPQRQMSPTERKTLSFQKHPFVRGVSGLARGNVKVEGEPIRGVLREALKEKKRLKL